MHHECHPLAVFRFTPIILLLLLVTISICYNCYIVSYVIVFLLVLHIISSDVVFLVYLPFPANIHQALCCCRFQMFPIPSNAQAKIEDVSRVLLNHVSQMPGKMSTSLLQQVSTGQGQPFADISKKLAVSLDLLFESRHRIQVSS